MRTEKIDIRNEASESYAALYTYILDDTPDIPIHKRPMVIVCPGGGYFFTSDREAENVALQFCAMGYHAAVLRYSVTPAVFPTAFLEVGKAVLTVREHAKEWHVHPDEIVVCGFSAGGHLAGSYGTLWNKDWAAEKLGAKSEDLRPNGMILCYPVINSGEYAHIDSFKNLLGKEFEEKRESLSLENCVTEATPRTFLWHTFEDGGVPVQNSLIFAKALADHHIPVELHVFETGDHGLSLANRITQNCGGGSINPACAKWIGLAHTWMEGWIDTAIEPQA